VTSPVHALRKELEVLAPAAQSPTAGHKQSPFARNARTHFARFVIIDDVAYPGRVSGDTLANIVKRQDLVIAQPQDHLGCPFLFFAVDFDAKSGADAERDSYLTELWNDAGSHLKKIFKFCYGFEATDGKSFAAYVARCQLDTTMSFNDYYAVRPQLPVWPGLVYGAALLITAAVFAYGAWKYSWWLLLPGVAVILVVAYATLIAAGKKPFPAAPDSDLKSVLKALYLRRTFTRFVIDNQSDAADPDAADRLYKAFKKFVDDNKPDDLDTPTQPRGVIGF
jgi:hypothetical protein